MVTFFQNIFKQLKAFLIPKTYYSWQAIIYLSLFSWLMSWIAWSLAANPATVFLLTSFSWMFLAFGVGWALQESKVKLLGIALAPWVAGAIICTFLFGWLEGGGGLAPALMSWPLVSVIVMAVPQMLTWEFVPKAPEKKVRQQLITVLLVSFLLTSWFQFYFRIQSWLEAYPSLLADSFENSGFVFRVPTDAPPITEGVALLTLTETVIQEEVANRPWSWVERWLLGLDGQLSRIRREVRDRLPQPTVEHAYWEIDMQPTSQIQGYELKLWAVWHGPASTPAGFYQEKICQLVPVEQQTTPQNADGTASSPEASAPTVWASFSCDLGTPRKDGQPPA